MNNLNDEDIQRIVERINSSSEIDSKTKLNNNDIFIYSQLFDELKKSPPGGLSSTFSFNVMMQIKAQINFRDELLFYSKLIFGTVTGFILGFLLINYYTANVADHLNLELAVSKVWLIMGIFFLILFGYIENNLLNSYYSKEKFD